MRPVSQAKIDAAKGEGLTNVDEIALACRKAGVSFAVGCAVFSKESGGRNIYGHDAGGCFSTSAGPVTLQGKTYPQHTDIPVTAENFLIFWTKVMKGQKSNGVGPAQITWASDLGDGRSGGWFRQMFEDDHLLPWVMEDNMAKGLMILAGHYRETKDWVQAGQAYNGRLSYGQDLWKWIQHYRALFKGI